MDPSEVLTKGCPATPFIFSPEHAFLTVLCSVTQSCPAVCNPIDCSPPGSSAHGDFPGKNTGVGCHALLQGIFPTQGLNPGLPQCRWILYHLSHNDPSGLKKQMLFLSISFKLWLSKNTTPHCLLKRQN